MLHNISFAFMSFSLENEMFKLGGKDHFHLYNIEGKHVISCCPFSLFEYFFIFYFFGIDYDCQSFIFV
jgi:hypothetical protein